MICAHRYQTRVAGERAGRHSGPQDPCGETGWERCGFSGGEANLRPRWRVKRSQANRCAIWTEASDRHPPPTITASPSSLLCLCSCPDRISIFRPLCSLVVLFAFQHEGDLINIMICKPLPLLLPHDFCSPGRKLNPLDSCLSLSQPEFCQKVNVKEAATRVGGEHCAAHKLRLLFHMTLFIVVNCCFFFSVFKTGRCVVRLCTMKRIRRQLCSPPH